jgi:hypothetical protein
VRAVIYDLNLLKGIEILKGENLQEFLLDE